MTKRDLAVIILATALGVALVLVTVAIVWSATHNGKAGLAVTQLDVQLLTGWGGGIIGVLGAYVGMRATSKRP